MKNILRPITMTSLFIFSFNALSQTSETLTKAFKASDIKELKLLNDSGQTLIFGTNESEAKVTAEKVKWNDQCSLDIELKKSELKIEHLKRKGISLSCEVNFKIYLPVKTKLEASTGSGDIEISNVLDSKIDLKTGSGNIKIEKSIIKDIDAKVGSGDCSIEGELAEADIKVGSGNVAINYSKAPLTGKLGIKIGSGNGTLKMPKNSQIKVNFKAGFGTVTNELSSNEKAPYSVQMKVGSGNLMIKSQEL